MSDNLIPNSFQVPNVYIDRLMPLLTDTEFRVLMFAVRHILGWQDTIGQRAARLSLSAFENGYRGSEGVGLGRAAIVKALEGLEHFGVLRRVGEPTRSGQMWELGEAIDWEGLKKRRSERQVKNRRRTQSAVSARAGAVRATNQRSGTSDVPESGTSDIPAVRATNQKSGMCDEPKTGTSDVPNKTHKKPKEQKPSSGLTDFSQASTHPDLQAVAAVSGDRIGGDEQGADGNKAAAAAGTKTVSERKEKSAGAQGNDPVAELVAEAAGQQNDEALERVYGAYMDEIGQVTATMREIIADAVREYGDEWVLSAIREAAVYNVRKWRYVEAVLRRKAGKAKPQEAKLRAVKIRWIREQGGEIEDNASEREIKAAALEIVGWNPALLPNFAQMQRAASR